MRCPHQRLHPSARPQMLRQTPIRMRATTCLRRLRLRRFRKTLWTAWIIRRWIMAQWIMARWTMAMARPRFHPGPQWKPLLRPRRAAVRRAQPMRSGALMPCGHHGANCSRPTAISPCSGSRPIAPKFKSAMGLTAIYGTCRAIMAARPIGSGSRAKVKAALAKRLRMPSFRRSIRVPLRPSGMCRQACGRM